MFGGTQLISACFSLIAISTDNPDNASYFHSKNSSTSHGYKEGTWCIPEVNSLLLFVYGKQVGWVALFVPRMHLYSCDEMDLYFFFRSAVSEDNSKWCYNFAQECTYIYLRINKNYYW